MAYVIQLIIAVIAMYLSEVLAPKPPKPKPSLLEDFDFPTVDDGTPQTVVFGEVWIKDWTVLGIGNYHNEPIILTQKGMFTSKSITTGYRYGMGLHMGLCRGMDDLVEIKVGDVTAWTGSAIGLTEILINQPDLFGGDKGEGGIVGLLKIMRGAEGQEPLAELAAMLNDTVPAYRGVVTFLFDGLVCANSPYPKPWSFRVRRILKNWDGAVWYPAKAIIPMAGGAIQAMNPVHILYELHTNRDWGRGFSPSQLDLASYQVAADKLFAEGFGLCLAWKRQDQISEFAKIVLSHINAAHFIDRTTGLWKLVLIRDDYTIGSLTTFNNTNGLLAIEEDNNSAQDVAMNQVIVTYNDPISNQNRVIQASNIASIQQNGVISQSTTYAGVPIAELAGRIASRDMKMATSGLKRFKVVLDRRGYRIQPASVFVINAPEQGIANIVLRAVRVDHDTITNGKITITAMQDIYGLPYTSFISEQPVLWQPPNRDALPAELRKVFEVPYFHLLTEFSANTLNETPQIGYVAALASKPGMMHLNYSLWSKMGTEAYHERAEGNFCYVGLTNAAIALSATAITVTVQQAPLLYRVRTGSLAMLDDEICRVDSVDVSGSQVTLSRGCLDTVPATHPADTVIWFYEDTFAADQRAYSLDNAVSIKLLPRTSVQQLSISAAPIDIITMQQRMYRPYVPCDVKINASYYPETIADNLTLTWQHRDRLQQTMAAPTWLDANAAAEPNTSYTLHIYDANDVQLLNDTILAPQSNYFWQFPQRFDGTLTTVLDIAMTGVNNSRVFTDGSVNNFPILNNFNALVKTDIDAHGGSAAFFDTAFLKTVGEYAKLDIYDQDHTIDLRVKTAATTDFVGSNPNALYFSVRHDQQFSENISYVYVVSIQPYTDSIRIDISGTKFSGSTASSKTITHTVSGLSADTYYDLAIQCTNNGTGTVGGTPYIIGLFTLFCAGNIVHTDDLDIISHGYSCALRMNLSPNVGDGSTVALNGIRITKVANGRHSGAYTPTDFIVGSSDPFWDDVVLLVPMTGVDGEHVFTDLSTNPVALIASEMVTTKTDAAALGGSAAYFFQPMLVVPPHAALNLRDKSFIIEGRAKGVLLNGNTIMRFTDSMSLSVSQYQLTLANHDTVAPQSISVSLLTGETPDLDSSTYFDFKVMRDAGTGITTLWFNDKTASAEFNPSSTASTELRFRGDFCST